MNMEEAVGAELRACRQRKQISQEQLGFDAGVHRMRARVLNQLPARIECRQDGLLKGFLRERDLARG
jgi:transcriptional regulator with XRE-family HTH domain